MGERIRRIGADMEQQCETCRFGKLQAEHMTYTVRFQDRLVIMPDVPTLICDVCGDFTPDPDFILRVEALLGVKPGELKADDHLEPPSGSMAYLAELAATRRWSV